MNALDFLATTRKLGIAARSSGLAGVAWGTTPGERSLRRLKEGGAFVKVRISGRPDAEVYADMVAGVLAANDRTGDEALAAALLEEITT